MNLIKVTSVSDIRTDKNGREYKLVEFTNPDHAQVVDETTGELLLVRVQAKRATITQYKESYLNNKPDFMWDAKLGEFTMGEVVTREVAPYQIDGKEINTYTTVVFGDNTKPSWEIEVQKAFRSAGHPIAGTNTAPVVDLKAIKATMEQKTEPKVAQEIPLEESNESPVEDTVEPEEMLKF